MFKKMTTLATVAALAALALSLTACAKPMNINGVTYRPYGLINASERQNPNVEYDISIGNLVWSVLLCETIIAPVYFFGWDIMKPVGPKTSQVPH